jgi:HSP20 family protein
MDFSENDEDLIFKMDFPGFEKEEIVIKATDKAIEISAQHKERKEVREKNFYRSEKSFGEVKRAFTFPVPVNPNTLTSEFKNGILTVRLKKKKVGKEIKIE